MADASEEGRDCEDLHLALLTIARRVPNVWPTVLDSEREEFSSICVAGLDFELSNLTQRPAITLRLRDQATWRAVRPYLMEMLVKKRGRCIFPSLSVIIKGLKADAMYTFFLDLMPKDQNVYRYRSGCWMSIQLTKPYPPPNQASLIHVSRIARRLGSDLMNFGVNFSLAKITADANAPISRNEIFVHGGQVYLPRYHILRHLPAEEAAVRQESEIGCRNGLPERLQHVGTYVIPETAFVAVTNYCSRHIASLKTERNIRAGGIRARLHSSHCSN